MSELTPPFYLVVQYSWKKGGVQFAQQFTFTHFVRSVNYMLIEGEDNHG